MIPVPLATEDIVSYVQNQTKKLTDVMEEGDSEKVFQVIGAMSNFLVEEEVYSVENVHPVTQSPSFDPRKSL